MDTVRTVPASSSYSDHMDASPSGIHLCICTRLSLLQYLSVSFTHTHRAGHEHSFILYHPHTSLAHAPHIKSTLITNALHTARTTTKGRHTTLHIFDPTHFCRYARYCPSFAYQIYDQPGVQQ
jgi:hypothetical protein